MNTIHAHDIEIISLLKYIRHSTKNGTTTYSQKTDPKFIYILKTLFINCHAVNIEE